MKKTILLLPLLLFANHTNGKNKKPSDQTCVKRECISTRAAAPSISSRTKTCLTQPCKEEACRPCVYNKPEGPQLTVVIVVDQLAYRHLEKLKAYLRYGLKFFMHEGICYKEAYVPYAWPETAPGHASLSTGTLPSDHGIITNAWFTPSGEEILSDQDSAERAAVFGQKGLQAIGRSPKNIMVDGISDQLMIQTEQHKNYKVFSFSGKSRSAICTANKLGKAIWLDDEACMFTSSKAYFDALPSWLVHFNLKNNIAGTRYTWHLAQPNLPAAYSFKQINNYNGSKYTHSLIGKTFSLCDQRKEFMQTPQANQLIFDVALACLDEHLDKKKPDDKLFFWVLASSLDKSGHNFGPESIEPIDILYHLDRQIQQFMRCVHSRINKRNVLWILTADHGMTLLPEQLNEKGYTSARRIMGPEVVSALNEHLATVFNVNDLVKHFVANNIYINETLFKSLDKTLRKAISKEIKKYVGRIEGIKKVRTMKEMAQLPTHRQTILDTFKNQLFKGRSGRFVVQSYPFVYIATKKTGLSHQSPYSYDTHIPIMIYRRGYHQRKTVYDRVENIQLAPTIAHLLGVPRPSACTANILPGIIWQPDPCF